MVGYTTFPSTLWRLLYRRAFISTSLASVTEDANSRLEIDKSTGIVGSPIHDVSRDKQRALSILNICDAFR